MGAVFGDLIRRFNEESDKEAREHFTPEDVVQYMARPIFLPVADGIRSGTYLVHDDSGIFDDRRGDADAASLKARQGGIGAPYLLHLGQS